MLFVASSSHDRSGYRPRGETIPDKNLTLLHGRDRTTAGGALQSHIIRNYLEDVPGVVAGLKADAVMNTAAINAAIATGGVFHLRTGSLIALGSSLIVPSNCAILSEGAQPATFFMPAERFINTSLDSVRRYGTNAVAITFSGEKTGSFTPTRNVRLQGFVVQSEPSPGRNLRGIVGQNVADWEIDVEVFGIPCGMGVAIASSRRSGRLWLNVHDFNETTAAWTVAQPESSGFEQDNDRINGIVSSGVVIESLRADAIRFTGAALAAYGNQGNGIKLINGSGTILKQPSVGGGCGQGFDDYSSGSHLAGGIFSDCTLYGVAKKHGAKNGSVAGTVIRRPGLAGVKVEANNTDADGSELNRFSGLTVSDVDPSGTWYAAGGSSGCVVIAGDKIRSPHDNGFNGCTLAQGLNGQFGWLDTSHGIGNCAWDMKIVAGNAHHQRRVYVPNAAGLVNLAGTSTMTADLV